MQTKRLTRIAVFTAAALILTLVENALPPLFPFAPGAKMGLPNAVILAALILLGAPDALVVLSARCLLAAIFSGSIEMLMYSLPAGFASFTVQFLLFRFLFPHISLMSISLTAAITHNMTQLLIASLIVGENLLRILPLLLVAGAIAGLFIGFAVFFTVKYLPIKLFTAQNRDNS